MSPSTPILEEQLPNSEEPQGVPKPTLTTRTRLYIKRAGTEGENGSSTYAIPGHGAMIFPAILALFYTLYLGRAILLPITMALVLNLVLKPIIFRLERYRIPPVLGSGFTIIVLSALLIYGFMTLGTPALNWVRDIPSRKGEIMKKLRPLQKPVDEINKASKEMDSIANPESKSDSIKVKVDQPGMADSLLSTSSSFIASAFMTITILFFLLSGGDRFLEKLVSLMPNFKSKRHVVALSRDIQQSISHYLATITCINIGLGVVMGLAMWAIGLPNPALWGVAAFLLNFVPFAGAAMGAVMVFAVGLLEFSLGYAFLAPVTYITINIVEANFITPYLLGKSMSLSPVVILLSLILLGWLWGIGGVLLAVPILVILKITCEHVEPLQGFGQLLAQ